MSQTASEGWLEVAVKFYCTRTGTTAGRDLADFGALVAEVTRELAKVDHRAAGYEWAEFVVHATEAELLAALTKKIGEDK
jgi:hypothetical protein